MTSQHGIRSLRVDVPTLEPDAVLLAQLVELSSASAPAATSSRASSMKVLLAAAGVAVVTATTWVAGAVPGTPSPLRPAHQPHTVVSPTPSPSGGPAHGKPGASDPTSKAPGSIHPTPEGRADGAAPSAAPTIQRTGTPPRSDHTGPRDTRRHHDDHGPLDDWLRHHRLPGQHDHRGTDGQRDPSGDGGPSSRSGPSGTSGTRHAGGTRGNLPRSKGDGQEADSR